MIDISAKFGNNIPERGIAIMPKAKQNKTPEYRLQTNARYHDKFERVFFRIAKDGSDGITPEMIKAEAAAKGQSVNAYIIEAIRQRMARY